MNNELMKLMEGWRQERNASALKKRRITLSKKKRKLERLLKLRCKRRKLSPRWKELSKKYRESKDNLCEICGSKSVDTHHKIPVSIDRSVEFVESNLIALCLSCHREQHNELPLGFFIRRFMPILRLNRLT